MSMTREITASWGRLCVDILEKLPEDKRKEFTPKIAELLETCCHVISNEEKETK